MTDTALTPDELTQVRRLLGDPLSFPSEFKQWVIAWIEANPPNISVNQLTGFAAFTATGATYIDTNESTASNVYTNLATVGPTLSGLAGGHYALFYGATMSNESGSNCSVATSINGAAPDAGAAIVSNSTANIPGATARLVTIPTGTANTVQLKYSSSASNTSHFGQRWLISFKYSNL